MRMLWLRRRPPDCRAALELPPVPQHRTLEIRASSHRRPPLVDLAEGLEPPVALLDQAVGFSPTISCRHHRLLTEAQAALALEWAAEVPDSVRPSTPARRLHLLPAEAAEKILVP